jgi:hypothetical protein
MSSAFCEGNQQQILQRRALRQKPRNIVGTHVGQIEFHKDDRRQVLGRNRQRGLAGVGYADLTPACSNAASVLTESKSSSTINMRGMSAIFLW